MAENKLTMNDIEKELEKLKSENIPGNPICISFDKEKGQEFINIKTSYGKLILKCQRSLWENGAGTEFTPEIRDSIMSHARRLYG